MAGYDAEPDLRVPEEKRQSETVSKYQTVSNCNMSAVSTVSFAAPTSEQFDVIPTNALPPYITNSDSGRKYSLEFVVFDHCFEDVNLNDNLLSVLIDTNKIHLLFAVGYRVRIRLKQINNSDLEWYNGYIVSVDTLSSKYVKVRLFDGDNLKIGRSDWDTIHLIKAPAPSQLPDCPEDDTVEYEITKNRYSAANVHIPLKKLTRSECICFDCLGVVGVNKCLSPSVCISYPRRDIKNVQ